MQRRLSLAALSVALVLVVAGVTCAQGGVDSGDLASELDRYPSYGEVFTKMLWLLGGTVLLLLFAAKVLPKYLGGVSPLRAGKIIQVVESHRLEPKKGLYLVRVAGRYLLLGTTESRIELLSGGEIDQVAVAAADGAEADGAVDPAARAFVDSLRARTATAERTSAEAES